MTAQDRPRSVKKRRLYRRASRNVEGATNCKEWKERKATAVTVPWFVGDAAKESFGETCACTKRKQHAVVVDKGGGGKLSVAWIRWSLASGSGDRANGNHLPLSPKVLSLPSQGEPASALHVDSSPCIPSNTPMLAWVDLFPLSCSRFGATSASETSLHVHRQHVKSSLVSLCQLSCEDSSVCTPGGLPDGIAGAGASNSGITHSQPLIRDGTNLALSCEMSSGRPKRRLLLGYLATTRS